MANSLVLKSSVFLVHKVASFFFLTFVFLLPEGSSSSPLFCLHVSKMFLSFPLPVVHLHKGCYVTVYVLFFLLCSLIISSLFFLLQVLSSTILVFIFFASFRSVSLSFSARSSQNPPTEAPRGCVLTIMYLGLQSLLQLSLVATSEHTVVCWGHMHWSPFVIVLNEWACSMQRWLCCLWLGHLREAVGLSQRRTAGRLPWVSEWFVWLTACFLTSSEGLSGMKMTGWVICSGTSWVGYPCFNYLMLKP